MLQPFTRAIPPKRRQASDPEYSIVPVIVYTLISAEFPGRSPDQTCWLQLLPRG
jgi:hypothetical protein